MILEYIDTVSKKLEDHRENRWVEGELSKLLSVTEEFKRVPQRLFVPHSMSGWYTIKFQLRLFDRVLG